MLLSVFIMPVNVSSMILNVFNGPAVELLLNKICEIKVILERMLFQTKEKACVAATAQLAP